MFISLWIEVKKNFINLILYICELYRLSFIAYAAAIVLQIVSVKIDVRD